jgi:hypothetical protein
MRIRIRIILRNWIRIRIKVEKLDPDPHLSQNSGALEAHNGAVETKNGALEQGFVDKLYQIRNTLTRNRIRIRIKVQSWIRIRI